MAEITSVIENLENRGIIEKPRKRIPATEPKRKIDDYWPNSLGDVIAYSYIKEHVLKFQGVRGGNSIEIETDNCIVFGTDVRPPDYSIGIIVRVATKDNEITRCFIPWRMLGNWSLGCGITIKTIDSELGFKLIFNHEECHGHIVHICWNRT